VELAAEIHDLITQDLVKYFPKLKVSGLPDPSDAIRWTDRRTLGLLEFLVSWQDPGSIVVLHTVLSPPCTGVAVLLAST